jgi:biotin transporter BioY
MTKPVVSNKKDDWDVDVFCCCCFSKIETVISILFLACVRKFKKCLLKRLIYFKYWFYCNFVIKIHKFLFFILSDWIKFILFYLFCHRISKKGNDTNKL